MPQGIHLSQRLVQSQVLAPQLQQSLALLQAPVLDLKALVEQAPRVRLPSGADTLHSAEFLGSGERGAAGERL